MTKIELSQLFSRFNLLSQITQNSICFSQLLEIVENITQIVKMNTIARKR